MSSAPPLSSGMISWKTPLPNVRIADELGALAVLQRAGHDLRRRRRVAIDEHDRRQLAGDRLADRLSVCSCTARPRVVTIAPSARNMLAMSCASRDEAAAVAAQVEDDALRAAALEPADRVGDLHVAPARAERRQRDVGDARAAGVGDPRLTTGTSIRSRIMRRLNVRLPRRSVSVTAVPSGPLMSAVAASSARPASLRPLACVTTSPSRRPARFAGELG